MTWDLIAQKKVAERGLCCLTNGLSRKRTCRTTTSSTSQSYASRKNGLTSRNLPLLSSELSSWPKRLRNGSTPRCRSWEHSSIALPSHNSFSIRALTRLAFSDPADADSLTEINFQQALAEAARCDEYLALTGEVVGPLHGVPISVKVRSCGAPFATAHGAESDRICFTLKGLIRPSGIALESVGSPRRTASLSHPVCDFSTSSIWFHADKAAVKEAGAVILAKTNVAQTMALYETINNVWGRTLNPFNRTLTPGGSSGGEAALVAFKGTPIGVGSDLGGSVRVPAA